MDFFILSGKIATLFIGSTMNLIINFQEPMDVTGARENLLRVKEFNKSKSFIITPVSKTINTNLIFYNNKTKYMFYVKSDELHAHDFVNVYDGKKDNVFSLKKETSSYRLLSGTKSILIENKSNKPIIVNNENVFSREVFSKGSPVFIKTTEGEDLVYKKEDLWN